MSETKTNVIIVVASPGYQVLLNIGNDCLTIDSFNPVNLSEMYSEDALRNCGSLQAHLRDGNLVYYEGQNLPEDPNKQKVSQLRQSAAQHLEVGYTQQARNADHPNMQIETNTDNINQNSEKTLQDRINDARSEVEIRNAKIKEKVQSSIKSKSNQESSTDPTSNSPLNKDGLNLKVAMDVAPEVFAAKQKAARETFEKKEQDAENTAQEEIIKLESDPDEDTTGGQQ